MNKAVRVRFAPSPTGELHVGNARTALFNWLLARHQGGNFVLRVEDTDKERTFPQFEQGIIRDLQWLGISWDEGPGKGGPFGPYRQSERLELYESCLKSLFNHERVYKCYCTEEELILERQSLLARGLMPRYMGKCRNLSEKQKREFEKEGRRASCRFKVGEGMIGFKDTIRGAMRFNCEAIGDFVIVRSSGIPAYNFAVVVDDHFMEISHVIRGEDHLTNTAAQLMIYGALGFKPPEFAHHSLILARDRSKLSKRHGSVSIKEFRGKGVLSEAMVNYLALLGSSFTEGNEIVTRDEMVREFSLERAGKSGAIFDEGKLEWVNEHYIRKVSNEELLILVKPFLESEGYSLEKLDHEWLISVISSVQGELRRLDQAGSSISIFFDDRFSIDDEAARLLENGNALTVIAALQEFLLEAEDSSDLYKTSVSALRKRTGASGRDLFMPLRAAVTGRTKGPELEKIFAILGRQSILNRIEKSLRYAGAI